MKVLKDGWTANLAGRRALNRIAVSRQRVKPWTTRKKILTGRVRYTLDRLNTAKCLVKGTIVLAKKPARHVNWKAYTRHRPTQQIKTLATFSHHQS